MHRRIHVPNTIQRWFCFLMQPIAGFTYYRNDFVSFSKNVRLWLPEEVQRYNYKITYGSVSTMNMSLLANGFYRFSGLYYSPGGLYKNVKKDKMIIPGMFASFMFSHLYIMIKVRRSIAAINSFIHSTPRYLFRNKQFRRTLLVRTWFDLANRITKHRVRHSPNRTTSLQFAINAARLFNFGFYFRTAAYESIEKGSGFFTAYYRKKIRHHMRRDSERSMYRMFRVSQDMYFTCLRETYRCIDLVYKVPEYLISLRYLDGFFEYCKYLYRHMRTTLPGTSSRVLRAKRVWSDYRNEFKQRRLERNDEDEDSDNKSHLFDLLSGYEWHDVVTTQLGLKPHKWYYSTIKRHRQRDWARNKFVRRQAKYHIEEKYHGQILDFESIIGRALELSKGQVYTFFKKVSRRESSYRFGLLFQALSNRLDFYLRRYFPQLTLSRIRHIISCGLIYINDIRIRDVHFVLDACDVVQFDLRVTRAPLLRGVDFLHNHYFITLFFSLFAIRNSRMRQFLKMNLFVVLHRILRRYFRPNRFIPRIRYRRKMKMPKTQYLGIKYWRIGQLNIPEVAERAPHPEHPYQLPRRSYTRYGRLIGSGRHGRYGRRGRRGRRGRQWRHGRYGRHGHHGRHRRYGTNNGRFGRFGNHRGRHRRSGIYNGRSGRHHHGRHGRSVHHGHHNRRNERYRHSRGRNGHYNERRDGRNGRRLDFASFLAELDNENKPRLSTQTRRRRKYVLGYLRTIQKISANVNFNNKVNVKRLMQRRNYFARSVYHRMRWGPKKERRMKRRGRFGVYYTKRTTIPLQRAFFRTRISSSVENIVHQISRYMIKETTWSLPTREHVVRLFRLFSNIESVIYILCFVRFLHKKLSVYVNPVFIERELTFKRMLRVTYGATFVRDSNAGKHARRVAKVGRSALHAGHSFWDRLLDNLYVSLQLMLPQPLVDSLYVNNYSLLIRHDLDIPSEYTLQRRQNRLFSLPLTSHIYANALMFKRFVYNKAQLRRTFAHSPSVTSRHVLFGPNRDTYNSYI